MKLVREHINEVFTDESDPIHDMHIGAYKIIEDWIKYMHNTHGRYTINNPSINNDLSIDATSIDISFVFIKDLPDYIKFNNIKHDFSTCLDNIEILKKHGPNYVGGNYKIYECSNKLYKKDIKKICKVKGTIIIYNNY